MDILIADDHPLYRDALSMLVQQLDDVVNTTTVTCYDDVIEHLRQDNQPNLILVDLHMPGIDAWQGIKTLRGICPDIPVVVISSSESEEDSSKALELGALGFIPKSLDGDSLVNALKLIVENGITIAPIMKRSSIEETSTSSTLTPRQHEVLQHLARGEANKVIARELDLSEGTVKLHVRAVFTALNVSNRTQAVRAAEKQGLVD
ncbi:MAG: response regulator [Gammaproteobacteria bacterium]